MTEDSSLDEGTTTVPTRERLLRFARIMGAGPDSANAVREALQAVAGSDREDPQQVWLLLANLLADLLADRYRQIARAQILARHPALAPHPAIRDSAASTVPAGQNSPHLGRCPPMC